MALPELNLDDVRFAELVEDAQRLIPRSEGAWTDFNPHDPGITLVELLAWLVENQVFMLDQVSERHRRKFLKLLANPLRPARPAQVDLMFSNDQAVTIKKGRQFIAQVGPHALSFETDQDLEVLPLEIEEVVSYVDGRFERVTENNKQLSDFYQPFGPTPVGGNALYLGLQVLKADALGLCQDKTLRLQVYVDDQHLGPAGRHGDEEPDLCPSVTLEWQYYKVSINDWQPLNVKIVRRFETHWQQWDGERWIPSSGDQAASADMTFALTENGSISFRIPRTAASVSLPYLPGLAGQSALFWIRAQLVAPGYESPPRLRTIQLNVVSATEGISVPREILAASTGLPHQSRETHTKPVVPGTLHLDIHPVGEEPGAGEDRYRWKEVVDFDASGPEDKHYMLDSANGVIRFGDGRHGCVPPVRGSNQSGGQVTYQMTVGYRYVEPETHAVGTEAAWRSVNLPELTVGSLTVRNLFPAAARTEAETVRAALTRVREELQVPFRAVTSSDFEALVRSTPGLHVARAAAKWASDEKEGNKVRVVVVPSSTLDTPLPSNSFRHAVCRHLDKHRLLTTRIEVLAPRYVTVSIHATIRIRAGAQPEKVQERVTQALTTFLNPLHGGPDGNGWPFGRDVYESEVCAVIERDSGVDGVLALQVSRAGQIDDLTLVCSGDHNVEVIAPNLACPQENYRAYE